MIDLELQLRDLGSHLDHPSGDGIADVLRARFANPIAPTTHARWSPRRSVVAALAAVAAVAVLAVALPPSRDALADLFGIGAVEIRRDDHVAQPRPTTHAPPTTVAPTNPAVVHVDLATARTSVEFPIKVPTRAGGQPTRVTVDHRVPGGLVTLDYPEFSVVEVASPPEAGPTLAKVLGPGSHVRGATVRGQPGLWITGTHHEIAYLDRDGNIRRGTARPTGHVLLWEEGGVTYRVEGFPTQTSATALATSIG